MSRRAAAALLSAVTDRGQALETALAATPSYAALQGRDRAFARAMATAALRRLGGLDAVIGKFLERPLPESAVEARAFLRVGAAQVLLLGTPAHAAVGETVAAASTTRGGRGFSRLINAVLRRVAQQGPALLAAQPPGADLPAWLFTRWRAAYGGETAAALARALRSEPPQDLSVRADAADWAERLGAELTATGSLRLSSPLRGGDGGGGAGGAVSGRSAGASRSDAPSPSPPTLPSPARGEGVAELPGFAEGAWWVQDAAAALPTRLLGDVARREVLDLCAAPGGKTLQLAAAGARVTAVDRSGERLARLKENLARTKLNAEIIEADALLWRPGKTFDAILLDAPCTSTGTLRRHPDVAWLRRPTDVRQLAELQSELLHAAAKLLKPGGVLVYAVCSLEPEEGPSIVAQAVESGVWRRAPIAPDTLPGIHEFITADGDLRTLPSHWPEIGGLDGFYATRLALARDRAP